MTYRRPAILRDALRDARVGAVGRADVRVSRGPVRVSRVPVDRGDGPECVGGGCPCELCSAVMAAMGLPHAARMHAGGAGSDPGAWSSRDWTEHMREEDDALFPVLERVADEVATSIERLRQSVPGYPGGVLDDPDGRHAARSREVAAELRADLARLRTDHAVYRALLAAGRPLPTRGPRSIGEHSALEDRIIERHCNAIGSVVGPGVARLCPPVVSAAAGSVSSTGFEFSLSKSYADSLPSSDAERQRAITAGAAAYYDASPARDDATKLSTLSADYPDKAKAAEKEADRKFREVWVGTSDSAKRIAVEIGGAAALLAIAYPLAIMGIAFYGAWEVSKKFWRWVTGAGSGFSDEWVAIAKEHVAEMLEYGVVPYAFDESMYVSPMGYAKSLMKEINVVRYLDAYAGPGMKEHFLDLTASVWRAASVDPVVREDVGKITASPYGWPLDVAVRTDSPSTYGGLAESRAMVEMVGLAAIRDEGAPVFVWRRVLDAAARGWNEGVDSAKEMRIARRYAYDGADYEDGDALVSPGGGAVAAMRAYAAARKEAKVAMGTWWERPAPDVVRALLPDATEHADTNPPSRAGMPRPTIDDPVPATQAVLASRARTASKTSSAPGGGAGASGGGVATFLGVAAVIGIILKVIL